MAIEALDVLYVPSRDVEADLTFYREVLGARVAFAIEAMGTRVAEVAISPQGARLVLAEHLGEDAPVLLHRVSDLDETLAQLGACGLRLEGRLELPLGPCATLPKPGRPAARLLPAHATRGGRALRRPRRLLISRRARRSSASNLFSFRTPQTAR
jgi:catechol 2,3-dioxygenase-like lactoylglutathione lyase family enzyme